MFSKLIKYLPYGGAIQAKAREDMLRKERDEALAKVVKVSRDLERARGRDNFSYVATPVAQSLLGDALENMKSKMERIVTDEAFQVVLAYAEQTSQQGRDPIYELEPEGVYAAADDQLDIIELQEVLPRRTVRLKISGSVWRRSL